MLSGHVLGRPCTAVFADAYFHYSGLFYSLTQDVTDIPTYLADATDHWETHISTFQLSAHPVVVHTKN